MAGQGGSRRWARNARKLTTKKKASAEVMGKEARCKKDCVFRQKRLNEVIPVSERRLDRGQGPFLIPRPWSSGKEWMRPREHPEKTSCFTGERLCTDSA